MARIHVDTDPENMLSADETGANMFFGDHPGTFFGQFQNNTNIYTAVRYSF